MSLFIILNSIGDIGFGYGAVLGTVRKRGMDMGYILLCRISYSNFGFILAKQVSLFFFYYCRGQ